MLITHYFSHSKKSQTFLLKICLHLGGNYVTVMMHTIKNFLRNSALLLSTWFWMQSGAVRVSVVLFKCVWFRRNVAVWFSDRCPNFKVLPLHRVQLPKKKKKTLTSRHLILYPPYLPFFLLTLHITTRFSLLFIIYNYWDFKEINKNGSNNWNSLIAKQV